MLASKPKPLIDAASSKVTVAYEHRSFTGDPFPYTTASALEGAAEAALKKERRREAALNAAADRNGDGLLEWCTDLMNRGWGGPNPKPKSARNMVDAWFSYWWGRPGRPPEVTKRRKTGHVKRVANWLDRQEAAGTVVLVDNAGEYGAKRYLRAKGTRLRRKGSRSV